MWRSIVLGKLIISILACFIVCLVCYQIAGHEQQTSAEAGKWYLLSGFFLLVGVSFCSVIYLLLRKPKALRKARGSS